jgi:hypothetical protein
MSSPPNRQATDPGFVQDKPKTRGFLHIVRHGAGPHAMYVVTYHDLDPATDHADPQPQPMAAEGAQPLIELLEELGVDFRLGEVRGALEDILRLGSANSPDLWFSEEQLTRKSLIDS